MSDQSPHAEQPVGTFVDEDGEAVRSERASGNGHVPEEEGSIRAILRAKRDKLAKQTTLDLEIPGYDGLIGARYNALGGKEVEVMGRNVRQGEGTQGNALLLVRSCQCILVRKSTEEEFEPLVEDGEQFQYELRLAELFGFEAKTAVQVAIGIFSPGGNRDLAISDQAVRVLRWMEGKGEQASATLLGE